MLRRRLVPLALAVTALLAVVAVAARGRPLGSAPGAGGGLPAAFWDYVFTSVVILIVLFAAATLAAMFLFRREPGEPEPYHRRTARALVILVAVALLVFLIGRHINLEHLLHPHQRLVAPGSALGKLKGRHGQPQAPQARHFRWEELVLVAVLLAVLGAAAALRRRPLAVLRRERVPEALAAALDDSLDDLRSDPDLRRAIVAAYARMESALRAAGLPRRPAEAPLEYLERTLLALELSEEPVRRLTDLFEWARFSQHEPEPAMRDEAVDALVAVRDELRAPEPVAR